MGLRKDRRGMIAVFDAMVFVLLLSMAATWMFVFTSMDDIDEPMAKTVSDDIFSMEVRTSDLMDLSDTKVLPIETLIAATMKNGSTERTERLLSETLDELIPQVYGYDFELEYEGHTLCFQRDSERELSSEYGSEYPVDGAGVLRSSLRIY